SVLRPLKTGTADVARSRKNPPSKSAGFGAVHFTRLGDQTGLIDGLDFLDGAVASNQRSRF
ncbi:MAG: hypothetical protein Q8M16_04875, partial [Pirellulaceae bacterium]|nr:hypothetical protein [Pirellulaceae bacterium]